MKYMRFTPNGTVFTLLEAFINDIVMPQNTSEGNLVKLSSDEFNQFYSMSHYSGYQMSACCITVDNAISFSVHRTFGPAPRKQLQT